MTNRLSAFLDDVGLGLRRLDEDHYTGFFDCGRDTKMDTWFRETALKWQREDMCAVWVLSKVDDPGDPVGFFTLSAHQIIPSNVNKKDIAADETNRCWVNNLRQPLPAQLLGKFALDKSLQGKGCGEVLMMCVYAKHVEAADAVGAKFLVIDVHQNELVDYYHKRFGFVRSSRADEMAQMYRPTAVIRQELDDSLF